jgi:predicted transcriptional regulator
MEEFVATSDPIEMTAEIVAAFVSNNAIAVGELPSLIEGLYASLKRCVGGEIAPTAADPRAPAVSIRKSVTPDYVICLEDGRRFKSMRRHLALLGMTPEQYRAKWGLPSTYPMVAPNYAAQRSAVAKNSGLGRMRQKPVAAEPATGTKAKGKVAQSPTTVRRKSGRPRKATH